MEFFKERRIKVGDLNVIEMEKKYDREGNICGYAGKGNYVLNKNQEETLILAIEIDADKLRNGSVSTRVIFVCRPLKYAKSVELGNRPNSFASGMFSYGKALIVEAISRGKIMNDFKYLSR